MDKLKLVRRTRDQIELSADVRRESVSGAFVARGLIAAGKLLLVDEVFTTGATLGEAARALRRAGAEEIQAPTLCRTG